MHDYSNSERIEEDELVAYAKEHFGAVLSRVLDLETGEIVEPGARSERTCGAPKRAVGLSNVHISLQPTVTTWLGGGLVKVSRPGGNFATHEPAKRGVVSTMSRASRRRLMYRLGMIKREIVPDFVTLTYPGHYEGTPKSAKQHLDTFAQRLTRVGGAAVWRLEFKVRKTGASEGESVPHFHMMLWRPSGWTIWEFMDWISVNWWLVVGSDSVDHLLAGTSCERMRSWRGVMSYAAKYICKADADAVPTGCGRMWGIVNRDMIPWAEMKSESITNSQCRLAFILFESIAGDIWREECPSRSVLVDSPEHWRDVILKL